MAYQLSLDGRPSCNSIFYLQVHVFSHQFPKFIIYPNPLCLREYFWIFYCHISLSSYLYASTTHLKISRSNNICEYHSLLLLFLLYFSLRTLKLSCLAPEKKKSVGIYVDMMLNLWIHLEDMDISQRSMSFYLFKSSFISFRTVFSFSSYRPWTFLVKFILSFSSLWFLL